jgi:hypothetical protein
VKREPKSRVLKNIGLERKNKVKKKTRRGAEGFTNQSTVDFHFEEPNSKPNS